MNLEVIGKNLVKLRQSVDFTQDELSEKLSISRQAVSKWETGVSLPSIEILLALSKLFNISINEILEPHSFSISDFEDIVSVDTGIVRKVLSDIDERDLIIALKGGSPEVNDFVRKMYDEIDFEDEFKKIGIIRLSEVERVHGVIVNQINLELIESN